jgi:acyl carrier protein
MEKIKEIFHNVLGIDKKLVNNDLSYQEYEKWDSLKHLQLVAAMEKKFDIELDTDDIIAMENVGKIREILKKYGVQE